MKYVSRRQLVESLRLLSNLRSELNPQRAQHILPFLALKKRGVTTTLMMQYAESDDYDFFNEYVRVRPGSYPYFDPIAGIFRIATHPHSNVATARKGTFFRSWGAAVSETDDEGSEQWKLSPDYLDIITTKVLTKAGKTTKVPAIPLAAFLLRKREFPDDFSPTELGESLKKEFNLTDTEYETLFEGATNIAEFETTPLTQEDILAAIQESGVGNEPAGVRSSPPTPPLKEDDEILTLVRLLLNEDEYAGVIFVGPPGTSKSWYAVRVARSLADGDESRIRSIQFHKSFQYEHFVEGFAPNPEGTGFEMREQLMLQVIRDASENPTATYVVLIDELSRSDPGRVFGELLTYMEPTRRNELFQLASGREISIGQNIVFIATMNSQDKSVLDIDDAFDRRMAKIDFPPSEFFLKFFLDGNNVDPALQRRIVAFFQWVTTKYPLGHTFFRKVRDLESLKRLWLTQLRYVFEKHFRYEKLVYQEIEDKFIEITGVTLR